MIIKCVEIRDHATCIPAIAIQVVADDAVEFQFMRRTGYPSVGAAERHGLPPTVILMKLADQRANSDPYDWSDRTHTAAHEWITDHFDEIRSGQVVDVRVILGEAKKPAEAEIVTTAETVLNMETSNA